MDVDIDETDIPILERGFRCAGKVVVRCADANYKIRFARHDVRAARSRRMTINARTSKEGLKRKPNRSPALMAINAKPLLYSPT